MFVRAPGENFRSPFGSRPGVGRDNFCDRKTARVGRTVIGVMTIHFSAVARPDEITDARLFCSWRSQADQSEPFFPALINSARRSNVRDKAGSTP
jgi:hypothetical protein